MANKEAEPPKINILQRINAVRKEVTYVQKIKKDGMKYSIVPMTMLSVSCARHWSCTVS